MAMKSWLQEIVDLQQIPQAIIINLNPQLAWEGLVNEFFTRLIELNNHFSSAQKNNLITSFYKRTYPDLIIIEKPPSTPYSKKSFTTLLSQITFNTLTNHAPRIIVIHQVEQLELVTANTLLKVIEQPPVNNYFLLLTNNYASILPTIKSRCCFFNFPLKSKPQKKVIKKLPLALFWNGYGKTVIEQLSNDEKIKTLFHQADQFYLQQQSKKGPTFNWTFQQQFLTYSLAEINYWIDFLLYFLSDFDQLYKINLATGLLELKHISWQLKPRLLFIALINLFQTHHE